MDKRRPPPIAQRLTDREIAQALAAHRRMSDFLRLLGWALVKGELRRDGKRLVFEGETLKAALDLLDQLEAIKAMAEMESADGD